MTYYNMIKKALNEKLSMAQGNYQVAYDPELKLSHVYMFGHKIFKHYHEINVSFYDFCGYEGYSKTTRAINCCLEAVGANYRVKTKKNEVIEVKI